MTMTAMTTTTGDDDYDGLMTTPRHVRAARTSNANNVGAWAERDGVVAGEKDWSYDMIREASIALLVCATLLTVAECASQLDANRRERK